LCANYENAKDILNKYEQEHLLYGYDKLDNEKKQELVNKIIIIDLKKIKTLYKHIKNEEQKNDEKIEPIEYIDKKNINKEDKEKYKNLGIKAIKQGKLAVVTMAGGQGTRLGHKGPKGTFMLGTTPNKSLFEILCDNLKEAKEKYNAVIPWYIMTSRENNDETVRFFETNNYFSYPKELIKFFKQGELPMLDKEGKILIAEDGLIKQAADRTWWNFWSNV